MVVAKNFAEPLLLWHSTHFVCFLHYCREITWRFELLPLPYQRYHEETVLILCTSKIVPPKIIKQYKHLSHNLKVLLQNEKNSFVNVADIIFHSIFILIIQPQFLSYGSCD